MYALDSNHSHGLLPQWYVFVQPSTRKHSLTSLIAWAPYDYIGVQLKQNKLVWRGLAAWCTLLWIVFSSMTPIRGWNYELFVLQHIISFAVFIGFVYLHTPVELNVYIWIPVALFFFDRLFRALRIAYANMSLFHPSRHNKGLGRGFWTCKGEFTPLPHNTTRITIRNPPISWTPGQHVFLSCHSIVPLQNHPFTIASIPEDGKMEFLVKAEKGGTRRFFRHAKKTHDMTDASTRYAPAPHDTVPCLPRSQLPHISR
jgi:predicted ferric reductase